jgi:hypothetical protein
MGVSAWWRWYCVWYALVPIQGWLQPLVPKVGGVVARTPPMQSLSWHAGPTFRRRIGALAHCNGTPSALSPALLPTPD